MSLNHRPGVGPRRRAPLGLVGALILVVGAELLIERAALDTLSGTQWGYRVAERNARTRSGRCQVLCFGDSLMKLALAPRVLEAESGLRAYNLAIQGGQAAGSYYLLDHALGSGSRPEAILVDFFPSLLATTPHYNDENLPLLLGLGDCLDLALTLREPDEFARLAVARWLPSARSRGAIRAQAGLALDGTPISIRAVILGALRNWRANRGAEIAAPRPGPAPDLDIWERSMFDGFRCEPSNRRYLERFFDLAARHGIPVFWVLPPYQAPLQERCDRSGFDREHEALIRSFQARHPNLFVLDARRSGYKAGAFVDWHHLGRAGAAVFSAEVGRALHDHLAREPRSRIAWTALPPYRPRSEAAPLEDGEQSRRIVLEELQGNSAEIARR